VLGNKGARRQDPEVADEESTSRGSVRELDEDLRTELKNLAPTKSSSYDEDEDDDTLSYFAKLAE